jgi:hypothetical protein
MARATPKASRSSATRAALPTDHAQAAQTTNHGADAAVPVNTPWAREALNASLLQTSNLLELMRAMQEAQARVLQDATSDIELALDEIDAADDAQALSAVPAHLFNAQCRHAMANAVGTVGRLFEIEADWLRMAQRQAAQRMSAMTANGVLPNGVLSNASTSAVVMPNGADEGSAPTWQQWTTQWQEGVTEMSRAWTEAFRSAQPRA